MLTPASGNPAALLSGELGVRLVGIESKCSRRRTFRLLQRCPGLVGLAIVRAYRLGISQAALCFGVGRPQSDGPPKIFRGMAVWITRSLRIFTAIHQLLEFAVFARVEEPNPPCTKGCGRGCGSTHKPASGNRLRRFPTRARRIILAQ